MLGRLVVASFLFAASNVAAEVPDVTVSIAPLASLVASVLGDLGHPHTLVPPGATEHVYALRPSDADALAGADLVVWIGPEFERFLAKPLAGLPSTTRILTLGSDPRLAHLPLRGGDSWPAHDHDGLEDRNDDHTELDGHLWLDPANARAIVAAVRDMLAELDPDRADRYRENARDLDGRLVALDAELAESLGPVSDRPFVVFHDAYQYLERRYGLRALGSILVDPDRAASARHLEELRELIADRGAACVFAEPQFDPGLASALVEGTGARLGVLDQLGASAAPGSYEAMLRALGAALVDCLSRPSPTDP